MSIDERAFSDWLASVKSALDRACGAAMQDGLDGLSAIDVDAANQSLRNLYADKTSGMAFAGGDCNYALKGVGALYTGHWHGKRVHDALSVLAPLVKFFGLQGRNVIDVGAGTGATLWAWSLIACFAQICRFPLPVHTWTSIDVSAEMLAQNDLLWRRFCTEFPNAKGLVNRQPLVQMDWKSPSALPPNGIILGSYLFSRADSSNPVATVKAFAEFVSSARASGLLLWSKPTKNAALILLKNQLNGWIENPSTNLFTCPKGRMRECVAVASRYCVKVNLQPDPDWPRLFNWGRAPTDVYRTMMYRPQL